ncbi:MAG: hypothetical protein U9R27_01510 [Campylobacterota bacterium]|nr:hypothetical protein [Campylobacterota bacterium]
MKWMQVSDKELFDIINGATMLQLKAITGYQKGLIDQKKYPQPRKNKRQMIELLSKLIKDEEYKTKFYHQLTTTPQSKELYYRLLWKQKEMSVEEGEDKFGLNSNNTTRVDYSEEKFNGHLSLIYKYSYWNEDSIYIHQRIRPILKLIHPLPDDYELREAHQIDDTTYTYSNESNILSIITTIEEMLKTNLIAFGKTGEKPLAKSLNILKSTTSNQEFFPTKKMDSLAMDMLTRSFSFYYWEKQRFKKTPLETLKTFITLQLNDIFSYTISRVFLSHIRKVKFGKYSDEQLELFDIVKIVIEKIPKKGWVDFDNIINYCNYRDFRIDLESSYATERYYMDVDPQRVHDDRLFAEDKNYNAIIFEPMLKGMFFYLGALGIVELKYNDPLSLSSILPNSITAKGKPYISVWDGLRYVKLTALGRYIFDFEERYTAPKIAEKASTVKFDEYKPIITIQNNDAIMLAKLEPYTDKYDSNRYILSYSKIFKGCESNKILEAKIDKFYTLFDKPVPVLFDNYFDEIYAKSNLLKREPSQVVIELENNKALLNIFMNNKKLQELVTKASGYRIIVSRKELPKLTKILKENGFFVEF